jgi:hypothetical protein
MVSIASRARRLPSLALVLLVPGPSCWEFRDVEL